jgi:Activator of Hsp90 ATPase homolog 1-like protein
MATCGRAAASPSTSTTTTSPNAGSPYATHPAGTPGSGRTLRHTSLVAVAVEPVAEGTRLHLTHTRLASHAPDYAAGWEVYLRRLVELVAGREVPDTWAEDWINAREGYATQFG